jgi:hypothetical protein
MGSAPLGLLVGDIFAANRQTAFNVSFTVVDTGVFLGPLAQAALSLSPIRVQLV